MTMEEYKDNGDNSADELSTRDKIESWKKENPAIANLRPNELSLLKSLITAPEAWRDEQVFLMCEFIDGEEALDHVAAYNEAAELDMDTGFNIAFMFALAASNRKIGRTSRSANIFDSVSHFRYTTNEAKKDKHNGGSEKMSMNG